MAKSGQVCLITILIVIKIILNTLFKLNKLTIPQLKELMKSKYIKSSGTKKQDLIDAINENI